MGRREGKLMPFIDERVKDPDIINLYYILYQGLLCFCLEFPRYNKNEEKFKFANEKIFKEWEEINGRTYKSYSQKDVLKSAIRRSRFYKVLVYENKKLIFRERSAEELVKAKEKVKQQKIKGLKAQIPTSPASSGYGTETSYMQVASPLKEDFSLSPLLSLPNNVLYTAEESYIQIIEPLKEAPSPSFFLSSPNDVPCTEKCEAQEAEELVEKFADQSVDASDIPESADWILFPMLRVSEMEKNPTEENMSETAQDLEKFYSDRPVDFSDLQKADELEQNFSTSSDSEMLSASAETLESNNTSSSLSSGQITQWVMTDGQFYSAQKPTVD